MITMRSDWWNADSYFPWIDPLIEAAFAAEIDLRCDLTCRPTPTACSTDPAARRIPARRRAPALAILAEQIPSGRHPETGTEIGYSTVLIAEASALTAVHRRARRSASPDRRTDVRGR